MLGDNVLDKNIALCCSGSYHKCACLDLIGDNCIVGTVKSLDTSDLDNVSTGTHNVSAHGVEEVCKVYDMRLFSCIFYNCEALSLYCCEHSVHSSSDSDNVEEYLISSATFPGYFLKTEDKILRTQASLDTALFVRIAEALGVTARYVGSEPRSIVTGIYNEVLSETLPAHGIECRVLPRKELPDGRIISASAVRQAIHDDRLDAVDEMLPEPTLAFFRSEEAKPIIAAIRRETDVVHY